MQPQGWPSTRDLVFVGAGHAAALVLRAWAMRPLPGARLTLINPDPVAPYSGMLPGHIAGHYARADMMIDIMWLGHAAGARVILGAVAGIDRALGHIHVQDRPPIGYDAALIDIGIGTAPMTVQGFAEHGVAAKPLGPFADRWDSFVDDVMARRCAPCVVVLGAGVAGVELSLAVDYRLRSLGVHPQITVLDRGDALKDVSDRTRAHLLAACAKAGIVVLDNRPPTQVHADGVVLRDGTQIAAAFVLGVAGARPQAWLADTGLALHNGFVRVGPTLQTETDPAIFAAGDIAHLTHAPRPKAGVYAVRAAPILGHNLRAILSGGSLRSYQPQGDYLKLISLGGKRAIADRGGLSIVGDYLWQWKNRIDQKFMAQFQTLPAMPPPRVPVPAAIGLAQEMSGAPLCGGCGAKLGPDVLRAGIAALPPTTRADVVHATGDDAAVLTCGHGVQVISTDHLRMLVADPYVMARITALHALGDVWAMGAQPQAGLAQVILPQMSARLQARDLSEITTALAEVLTDAGAALVGGHTTQGAEGVIGLTVTGLAPGALAKTTAQPGDTLILTRPLGSGIVMAALMQPPAPGLLDPDGPLLGEAVATALTQMQRPGGHASAILARHASALTDVTGFGLAGHLGEMLGHNRIARLQISALPLLPLVQALARAGIRAHLDPANRAGAPPVTDLRTPGRRPPPAGTHPDTPDGVDTAVLYDPQTAGGFLAAVPADHAADVLAELRATCEPNATAIGTIAAGPAIIQLVD